jgi:orotate phosphoribosyltransferase-like protein
MISAKTIQHISSFIVSVVITGTPVSAFTSRSMSNSLSYSYSVSRREEDDGVPGTGSVPVQQGTVQINTVLSAVTTTSTTSTTTVIP